MSLAQAQPWRAVRVLREQALLWQAQVRPGLAVRVLREQALLWQAQY